MNQWQRTYIDAWRALAATLVLASHTIYFFAPQSYVNKISIGGIGVYLFFIMSGFLISQSVFRATQRDQFDVLDYLCDRFSRIYTAYLPALCVSVLVAMIIGQIGDRTIPAISRAVDNASLISWIGNLFMLQGNPVLEGVELMGGPEWAAKLSSTYGTTDPFWTISIEWWIYVTFGLLVFYAIKGWKLGVLGFASLCCAALTPAYFMVGGAGQCLTALWGIGAVAGFVFTRSDFYCRRLMLVLSAVFCAFALARVGFVHLKTGGIEVAEFQFASYLTISFMCGLFALPANSKPPEAIGRLAAFVAGYSYSLYLIHFPVLLLIVTFAPTAAGWQMVAIAMSLSHAAAIGFWWLFERHYKKIGAYIKSKRRKLALGPQGENIRQRA